MMRGHHPSPGEAETGRFLALTDWPAESHLKAPGPGEALSVKEKVDGSLGMTPEDVVCCHMDTHTHTHTHTHNVIKKKQQKNKTNKQKQLGFREVLWDSLLVHCEGVSLPRHLLIGLIKS